MRIHLSFCITLSRFRLSFSWFSFRKEDALEAAQVLFRYPKNQTAARGKGNSSSYSLCFIS